MSKLLDDLKEISQWGDDNSYSKGFRDGVKTAIKRIELGSQKDEEPTIVTDLRESMRVKSVLEVLKTTNISWKAYEDQALGGSATIVTKKELPSAMKKEIERSAAYYGGRGEVIFKVDTEME